MSKKSKCELRCARGKGHLVQIHRSLRHVVPLDGFVVEIGAKWALLAVTGNGGYLEGWTAVRVRDITRVTRNRSFEAKFAARQPLWPPRFDTPVDLDSTAGVIQTMGQQAGLIAVEQEKRISGAMWIGRPTRVRSGRLELLQVDPKGRWHDKSQPFSLRHITSITIGSRYLTALEHLLQEDTPPSERGWGRSWFAVRLIIRKASSGRDRLKSRTHYEERITVWSAVNAEQAIARAESEAYRHVDVVGGRVVEFAQSYQMADPLVQGAEVFSLIRTSSLTEDDYVATFFDAGGEHQTNIGWA